MPRCLAVATGTALEAPAATIVSGEGVIGLADEIELGVALKGDRIENNVENGQEIQGSGCS